MNVMVCELVVCLYAVDFGKVLDVRRRLLGK